MQNIRVIANHHSWGLPVHSFCEPVSFYNAIDYLLVTSQLEGGPVPFMEALACGKLSIAPPIGVIPQFPHIEYRTGSVDDLKRVISEVKEDFSRQKNCVSATIQKFNWEYWSLEHERLFRRLLLEPKLQ